MDPLRTNAPTTGAEGSNGTAIPALRLITCDG
jgi:hypothetical protein